MTLPAISIQPARGWDQDQVVSRLQLNENEAEQVMTLARQAQFRYDRVDNPVFLQDVRSLSQQLPLSVRMAIAQLAVNGQIDGALLVSGHEVSVDLGPTPDHWSRGSESEQARTVEFTLMLYGALAGYPFGWRTQQNGRMIHDVLPIVGHQNEQLGSGSHVELTLHTEDAFHDNRADLLLLFALRNRDRAATTIVAIGWIDEIDPILFEERFLITPDESHLPKHNVVGGMVWPMDFRPRRIAVLSGDRRRPYLRVDPYFMAAAVGDYEAASALANFDRRLQRAACDLILDAGDLLVVDNHRVAHGRRSYMPRFDGTDRWLKRGLVARDFRPSAELRKGGWLL